MYGTHDVELKTDPLLTRPPEPMIGLQDIVRFLKYAWPRILIAMIITTAIAAVYLTTTKATYTAPARLIFDPKSAPSFDLMTRWLEPSAEMTTRIESQVEVLRSELVARKVIAKLNLANDPEFAPRASLSDRLTKLLWPPAEPSQTRSGSEVEASLGIESIIPGFLYNLSVRRVGLSAVIEIAYTAEDPEKAARITNTLANTYIENSLEQKAEAARNGSIWLRDRLKDLRKKAFDAALQAERFKSVGAGTVSDSSVRFAELESIAQTYQRVYESFLLKFTESLQRISYPVSDAHLVTAASPLFVAKTPKRGTIVAFAMTLGIMIGTAFSIAQLALDRRIRHKQMIADAGLRLLGLVNSELLLSSISTGAKRRTRRSHKKSRTDSIHVSALSQLRAIQMAIKDCAGVRHRTIGVVGVGSDAGCSSIAVELAHTYAATGAQTLLVDANLEDPALSRQLASQANSGFVDILQGKVAPDETIIRELPYGFAFMPLGNPDNEMTTPGLLLNANCQQPSLDAATTGFDVCVFDLSSLPASPEAHLIAPFLDGVVLVAQFDVTKLDDLKSAVADLEQNNGRILGVVLNKKHGKRRNF